MEFKAPQKMETMEPFLVGHPKNGSLSILFWDDMDEKFCCHDFECYGGELENSRRAHGRRVESF